MQNIQYDFGLCPFLQFSELLIPLKCVAILKFDLQMRLLILSELHYS